MWENESKKIWIRNGIIFLLLVIVTVGLFATLKTVNAKIAEEEALLQQEFASQLQEENSIRRENLETVQQMYDSHQEILAQYLPGIICWGDSLTAGSSGNVSYPLTLQKYINTYLCDIYDLRYSLKNPESYPVLNWDDYKISVPIVNMGGGQENAATILGRSGVVPFVVKTDFVIPAGKESVSVTIQSEDRKAVSPLKTGDVGLNPITIAGVEGILTRTSDEKYQFTRLEEGQETEVLKGTEIVSASKDKYRDYIHIVWLGTYDEYKTPATLVQEIKTLLERQTANPERYLVIGPCTYQGSWAGKTQKNLDDIDSAMIQAFGNRYINFRKYLVVDGLQDAALSATKEDTASINKGMVPNSFRSNASGADLNSVAYDLLGKLVYGRMELLGYFDEIRETMNLDEITQDLLKNNPEYFETLLK